MVIFHITVYISGIPLSNTCCLMASLEVTGLSQVSIFHLLSPLLLSFSSFQMKLVGHSERTEKWMRPGGGRIQICVLPDHSTTLNHQIPKFMFQT